MTVFIEQPLVTRGLLTSSKYSTFLSVSLQAIDDSADKQSVLVTSTIYLLMLALAKLELRKEQTYYIIII